MISNINPNINPNKIDNKIYSVDSAEICPDDSEDKRCAPGIVFENGSCYKVSSLVKMIEAYNLDKHSENAKIKLHQGYEILNPPKYKRYLLKELTVKLNGIPQRKWVEQSFVKKMESIHRDELVNHTFRPEGPDGKFEWLNTINIEKVVSQYEKKYIDFQFFGAVPIDFDTFGDYPIAKLNYDKFVRSGKTKLGIVFNLDEHWQSGSHWVAMFADLSKGHIFFFDSYGIEPEPRIQTLMRRIAKYCESNGMKPKNIRVEYNKYRHQRKNSECGVYSINFILRMLKGISFDEICKSQIHDDKINKCRNVYFKNAKV